MFRIGRNTFYDRKNKIPMKILEFKRSRIGLITEFCKIPNGFPNQAKQDDILGQEMLILDHIKMYFGTKRIVFLGQEKSILSHNEMNYGTN
jgi:hypothetical protein